ncbi:hypothetical protein H106_07409 [Trichophyton rubrum CBS 735.88]|nr:hypothetical protein H106_07409 [Trichophyton rubrum CBS 735.88]
MEEWSLQLPLEDGFDISDYRKYLSEWAAVRRTTKTIKHFSEATEPLSVINTRVPQTCTISTTKRIQKF